MMRFSDWTIGSSGITQREKLTFVTIQCIRSKISNKKYSIQNLRELAGKPS